MYAYFFFSVLFNQLMTSDLSFHWFKLVILLSLLFIFSRMDLLNLPILFSAGFISLVFGLLGKFGLWSFRDIKHSMWSSTRILFAVVLSFTMFFLLSWFVCWCFHLLLSMWLWMNLLVTCCTFLFLAYIDLPFYQRMWAFCFHFWLVTYPPLEFAFYFSKH